MLETYKQQPQAQIGTPAESPPAQLTLGLVSGARCQHAYSSAQESFAPKL